MPAETITDFENVEQAHRSRLADRPIFAPWSYETVLLYTDFRAENLGFTVLMFTRLYSIKYAANFIVALICDKPC